MSPELKVTLFVPTLNEIDGMRVILPQIKKEWCHQILIVDAHSTDGTAAYAREHGYETIDQQSRGVRRAYIEALPHVRGDIMIPFSPDGNSIPDAIPQLAAKFAEGYDLVHASRYAPGASSEDDTWLTSLGNTAFTRMINLLYGGHYTDAMGMYKAFRPSLLRELDLDKEERFVTERVTGVSGIGLDPLMSIRALKRKLRIAEIPASEPKRIGGEKKMRPFRWGLPLLLQVLRELYYWK